MPERYRPDALVALVTSVLDAMQMGRAIFVGFSWGGDLGCHLAACHPERLCALVILDAGYRDPPFDPLLPYETYVRLNERKVGGRGVAVAPWIVAAVEHGIANAPPSATRGAIAASGLPLLLVAAGDAGV